LKLEIRKYKFGTDETSLRVGCIQTGRSLIRKKVLSDSNATEYKAIIEKLGSKLNAFIKSTKA
jgi:hypothetical protein